jgi:GntR family transcriptional regulator of vanillate catabolism
MSVTPHVEPLSRVRLVDEVTDRLRSMIISGQLPPGTQLLQIELAQQLGVSRTPLREAFRVLERDGLLRNSNGNKTVEVVSFTSDEVIDLYQLREVLDGLAARLAAKHGLAPDMEQRLEHALTEMERSAHPGDLAHYSVAHLDFHLGIAEASHNSWLLDSVAGGVIRMSSQMVVARFALATMANTPQDREAAILTSLLQEGNRDHRAIFEEIRAGNTRQAEAVARRHIRKAAGEIELLDETARREATT